jgi:predicted TIM-barrel fold metal-dependent hydrolase
MEIFDIHHHLGSLTGGSLQEEEGWQDRDYNNRVRIMQANDTVAAYRKRDPKRFPVACGTVEPLHGARSLEELERVKHELHLEGVVWHKCEGGSSGCNSRLWLAGSLMPTPGSTGSPIFMW